MTAYQLAGSPLEEWRRSLNVSDVFRYTKRVHCPWANRYVVANALWNATVQNFPCRAIRIVPLGEDHSPQPIKSDESYEKALIIAEYGPLDHERLENYWTFRERLRTVWESLPIEAHNLIWEDGQPVALSQRPTATWPFLIYEFAVTGLSPPSCPPLGCVNSGSFSTVKLGMTWAAGRVRYDGIELDTKFHQAGTAVFSYVHQFKIHPYHWDYSWREDGQWLRFADPITGDAIERYPKANLVFS